jgi:anti-sigma regulatory factor (Ser/Thr protein kinase)
MRDSTESAGRYRRTSAFYDGDPASASAARDVVAAFLGDVQVPHGVPLTPGTIGAAQLVVSELVTNACKYAPGPCLLDIETDIDAGVVKISLWDSDTTLPLARAAEPGRIGQHGLEIVLALCEGFDVQREAVGKRITARLRLTADR